MKFTKKSQQSNDVPYPPPHARFLVLGYRVSAMTLLNIAYNNYKNQYQKDALMAGIQDPDKQERLDWIHKGVQDAMELLDEKTKIPYRLFCQRILPQKEYGFLLGFCSSEPLYNDVDGEFHYDKVRPLDKMDDIFEFGKMVYFPDRTLPFWSAPDASLKLTYMGEPLY